MKIYLIKSKGKTWIGNFVQFARTMTIGDKSCYVPLAFFRRKDAVRYLENSVTYEEFVEIISVEVFQSKKDNRRTK